MNVCSGVSRIILYVLQLQLTITIALTAGVRGRTEGGLLYLDFTHSEGDAEGGLPPYAAPEVLMFPPNSVVALRFAERSSRQMRLEWTNDAGRRIVYELKKTW